jgi:hypothetical protein
MHRTAHDSIIIHNRNGYGSIEKINDIPTLDDLYHKKMVHPLDYDAIRRRIEAQKLKPKNEDNMATPDIIATTALKIRDIVGEGSVTLSKITLSMLMDAMPKHSLQTIAEGIDWLAEGGFKITPRDWVAIERDRARQPGWYMVRQQLTDGEVTEWRPLRWDGKRWESDQTDLVSTRTGDESGRRFALTGFDIEICEDVLPVPVETKKPKKDKK